jgi:nitrite reductase/ring-hydroxylating ferredoxin subunit
VKSELNRRELLTAAAAAACLCCLGDPSKLLADTTSGPTLLDVGPKAGYVADGITTTWMAFNKVAVIRHSGKLYACTDICTHRGATIKSPDGQSFECPRHHAKYDINGNVTQGPAKRSLNRFAISVDANGHVIVDKSTQFDPDHWDDPASFIVMS